jgi:uncharacterized membrane protein YgcG
MTVAMMAAMTRAMTARTIDHAVILGGSGLAGAPYLTDTQAAKRLSEGSGMQRRFFIATMASAVLVASGAMAAGVEAGIAAQLSAQGYDQILVETTWLGRLKITAHKDDSLREIVVNPRTGEILRDILRKKDGTVTPRLSEASSSGSSDSSGSSGSDSSGSGSSGGSGHSGDDDGGDDSSDGESDGSDGGSEHD